MYKRGPKMSSRVISSSRESNSPTRSSLPTLGGDRRSGKDDGISPLSIDYSSDIPQKVSTRHHKDLESTVRNFTWMSILFSANHGCVVACLALATSQLGSVGAWQSGILYLSYTLSAILGATYLVKELGSRNSLVIGMSMYVAYVGCFAVALHSNSTSGVSLLSKEATAYMGAVIGGWGAGILWTAQGSYFAQAAEEHAYWMAQTSSRKTIDVTTSTATLAGIFAFWYLLLEVLLRVLSTLLLELHLASWDGIFVLYTGITVLSALATIGIQNYTKKLNEQSAKQQSNGFWYKATAALQLLYRDPKMRHLIGLNAAYGFASAFCNSYINGEVVPIALNDFESKWLGLLTSWGAGVAAIMSLVFKRWSHLIGKGTILVSGACCFIGVALLFVVVPTAGDWSMFGLLSVYSLMGIGRATFEGPLKATFADFFPYEKEGAFANIIIQNGLSGAFGFALSFNMRCSTLSESRYCVQYRDGSHQYVLLFEVIVIVSSMIGIFGYSRAAHLHDHEFCSGTSSKQSTPPHSKNEQEPLIGSV